MQDLRTALRTFQSSSRFLLDDSDRIGRERCIPLEGDDPITLLGKADRSMGIYVALGGTADDPDIQRMGRKILYFRIQAIRGEIPGYDPKKALQDLVEIVQQYPRPT